MKNQGDSVSAVFIVKIVSICLEEQHLTLGGRNVSKSSELNSLEHTVLFREDFLLPLKSSASLYHRVEESHLKQQQYFKDSDL